MEALSFRGGDGRLFALPFFLPNKGMPGGTFPVPPGFFSEVRLPPVIELPDVIELPEPPDLPPVVELPLSKSVPEPGRFELSASVPEPGRFELSASVPEPERKCPGTGTLKGKKERKEIVVREKDLYGREKDLWDTSRFRKKNQARRSRKRNL